MASDNKKLLMYVLIAIVVYMLFFSKSSLYRRRYAMQIGPAATHSRSTYAPKRRMKSNYDLHMGGENLAATTAGSNTAANAARNAAGADLANPTGAGPAKLPYSKPKRNSLYNLKMGGESLAPTVKSGYEEHALPYKRPHSYYGMKMQPKSMYAPLKGTLYNK
jgi:hypothetical protein